MILGIIFDFDNTLYNYENINNLSLNKLFENISNDFTIDINKIKDIYKKINKNIKESNNYSNKFNKSIYIKKLLEELNISLIYYSKYLNLYNNEFNDNFKLYDNVLDFFKLMNNYNIKIGILSNNVFIQQYDKLKLSGLIEYIYVIQTSDECGEEKPNLNTYLNIIHKLNLNSENIAYIGDNYEHDIIPALELKILPFHFIKNSLFILKNKYFEFGNFNDLIIFFENYFKTIDELVFLSKYFGQSNLNVQGPGGNISIKLNDIIFIKSSGAVLGNMSYMEGYCLADNRMCKKILENGKELELKNTKLFGYKIPSMETFFHSFMNKYTVHIHFTLSNIFFCSNKDIILENFKFKYEIIDYIPPGLLLSINIKSKYNPETYIYFLKNHGLIITHNNINDILIIYNYIYHYFNNLFNNKFIDEYNTFLINKIYYEKKNKSIIVKYLDYPFEYLDKIKYCFPDLAIFIEKIKIIKSLEDLNDNLDNYNIIIIDKKTYICAENLTKAYYVIELLDKYKILCDYSYKELNNIGNIFFLQNMEQEKFRKL